MAIVLHFIGGVDETIEAGETFRPYQNPDGTTNNEFVEVMDAAGRTALAPVSNLLCIERV